MTQPGSGRRPAGPRRPGGATQPGWPSLWPSLTARSALAVMSGVFLIADLAAARWHLAGMPGFGFAAGSVAAAGFARRRELLIVVTTPPALFVVAATAGELLAAHAEHVPASAGSVGGGLLLTLTAAAPWLFGGLAGALVIAVMRGLPECVRLLRAELSGSEPSGHGGVRRRG